MANERFPSATIVVPVRNEASTIAACLAAIAAQDYPAERWDVLVVDGASTDDTRSRAESAAGELRVPLRVLSNPARSVPAALNLALAETRGEYFVRVDGHSQPDPAYVRRCVEQAEALGAGLAGGWVDAVGRTPFGRAVAAAVRSPFATGNAASWNPPPSPVEVVSVPCGAYRTEALRAIGGFDEGQLANQDYEANLRLRAAGWKAYLLPDVRFEYVTRSTPRSLARQFVRYGYFRARTLVKHPSSARPRHLAPPAAALLGIALVVVAVFWSRARIALAVGAGLYLVALAAVSLQAGRRLGGAARHLPLAFAIMHACWSVGSLAGLVRWTAVRRRVVRRS